MRTEFSWSVRHFECQPPTSGAPYEFLINGDFLTPKNSWPKIFMAESNWGWPVTQLTGPKKAPQKWVFWWGPAFCPFFFGAQEFPLQVSVAASGIGREGMSRRAPHFPVCFFGRPGNGSPGYFREIWVKVKCLEFGQ